MATNEPPKDTLGDHPRYRIAPPAQPPTKQQQELRKAQLISHVQKALRELDTAYKQAKGYADLSRAILDAKAELGRQVVKLSGPVISLGELVE